MLWCYQGTTMFLEGDKDMSHWQLPLHYIMTIPIPSHNSSTKRASKGMTDALAKTEIQRSKTQYHAILIMIRCVPFPRQNQKEFIIWYVWYVFIYIYAFMFYSGLYIYIYHSIFKLDIWTFTCPTCFVIPPATPPCSYTPPKNTIPITTLFKTPR